MIDNANQGDVRRDLFRACFATTNKSRASVFSLSWVPPDVDGRSIDPALLADTIKTVMAGLATLEAAANRAAQDAPARGRPEGTGVLPPSYILALARMYRERTGSKPDMGEPFVPFVREFLAAVGQPQKSTGGDTSPDYVVEMIKYARRQARKNPSRFAPSPFDE
jgi:hypothetical protein